MIEIVLATSNDHKLQEIRKILPESFKILGLRDLDDTVEIPETGTTFSANALIKARYLFERYKLISLGDDSGLEVMALNGQPGVFSARYAGEGAGSAANVSKLLSNMSGVTDRRAQFRTVLALILNGDEYLFEGSVKGTITTEQRGAGGFGYDPVFIPDGYKVSFAEMSPEEKNRISHRAIATRKLQDFLKKHFGE